MTKGPRVLFLPFPCIIEKLLTEGGAVQAPESGGLHVGPASGKPEGEWKTEGREMPGHFFPTLSA